MRHVTENFTVFSVTGPAACRIGAAAGAATSVSTASPAVKLKITLRTTPSSLYLD
jgi:hypothetical protein